MAERLPIYEIESDIIRRLKQDRRLILSAPTGSGKSTQVPQMLLRHGLAENGQVVALQPRRLATRLLAARVASELGVKLGEEVGYQIRFENVTSAKTRIRFVTEGVLLRQMIEDPQLRGVSAILFDEFHERHLYGDITLARALDQQERYRPDLLLTVMSATLDAKELEKYLAPCSILASSGRTFPVEIEYLPYRSSQNGPPVWETAGLDTQPREVKEEALQKCILIGFSDRVSRRLDEGTLRCEMVHGRRGVLARESKVQHSPLFVAAEIREIEGRDRELNTVISLATAVDISWLRELFPSDLKSEVQVQYDAQQKRVLAAELLRFRGLALAAKRIDPPPADLAAKILADEIIAERLSLPNWDHSVEQWLARLSFLCATCPDLQLPEIQEDDKKDIIQQLCHGAVSYKDIKEREVKPMVVSWLSAAQRELLDQHAPERLKLPNDRTPKVNYEKGKSPFISLRIQELYDVNQTPKIAMGRVPVTVHILTPGMKPVQVTQDLANFWREHYPKIKSELQRRYPKHFWR